MLQVNNPRVASFRDDGMAASEFVSPAELFATIEGFVRRQLSIILFMLVLAMGLGGLYLFTSPPRYTGHAVIVIDTHQNQQLQQQPPADDLSVNSAAVDTQIEILRSDKIAQAVVKDLHLNEDPEFIDPPPGSIGTILRGIQSLLMSNLQSAPLSEEQAMRAAIRNFKNRLTVYRVGVTYAIDIQFKSFHPERAAQIANAIADAYVGDALDAKYQTTRRAAIWLQSRLKELREQATNAERAVVDYKNKNNIVNTGGQLLNEQQVAELSSSLIQARATTAEAKARLDRVSQILKTDDVDPAATSTGTVADSLHNQVIIKLRQQYLEDATKEADWVARYGNGHLAVINLRSQMGELRKSILDELQRIAQTYRSDYEIARTREESVQQSLSQIVAQSQATNEARITLNSLESGAQTSRALYDNFLQRYMESVQQQSFPLTEARVITPAVPPHDKSAPKGTIVFAVAALAGLLMGVGAGLLRDVADRVFRTSAQVEEHLDTNCIAMVPKVGKEIRGSSRALAVSPATVASPRTGKIGTRTIRRDQSVLWAVLNAPFSRYSESIRAIKVAVDLRRSLKENKVIAITSSLPNEGKSTIATALAQLTAQTGNRAVLVDCDLRNPALTRRLAPDATVGILDVIAGRATIEEVTWTDPATQMRFVPAVLKTRVAHTSEILASAAMRKMFDDLRDRFDYVIVDLSPLTPVVDVRAMTHLADSFVLVVEWGRCRIEIVEQALKATPGVHENLLGAVLNKADVKALSRYETAAGNRYYKRYSARYGYTD